MRVAHPHEDRFWRGHVRLGATTTAVCALVGIGYALSTPAGPNRVGLLTVGVLALVTAPLIVTRRALSLLSGPGRSPYLYAWSVSLLTATTVGVALDGGATSPLTPLFAASLVFTASGFDRRGAICMGGAQIGCYLLTCAVGSPGMWRAAVQATALGVVAATCALASERLRGLLDTQEALAEQLREQASRDGLTGCLNHRAFTERLDEAVARARRSGEDLGLILLDLDAFKAANDRHGHVAGDELLASLGVALRAAVRAGDVTGRLGGDEFAVLAPGADGEDVTELATRVQRAAAEVGAVLRVSASVGVAVLGDAPNGRALRQRADVALYEAKASGRETAALLG